MELTIKNVKINKAMSDETCCFSATIYIDGKKAGLVANRGHGGLNELEWLDVFSKKKGDDEGKRIGHIFEDWLDKETMPVEGWDGGIELLETVSDKLEHLICVALDQFEEKQWYKTQCRNRTLFHLKDETNDAEWRTVKAAFGPEVKAWLMERFGDQLGEIANETRI